MGSKEELKPDDAEHRRIQIGGLLYRKHRNPSLKGYLLGAWGQKNIYLNELNCNQLGLKDNYGVFYNKQVTFNFDQHSTPCNF